MMNSMAGMSSRPPLFGQNVRDNQLKVSEVKENSRIDVCRKGKVDRSRNGGVRTPRLVVYLCTVVGRKAQQKRRVHRFPGTKCKRMRSKLQG
jgi:hypothetical protein